MGKEGGGTGVQEGEDYVHTYLWLIQVDVRQKGKVITL